MSHFSSYSKVTLPLQVKTGGLLWYSTLSVVCLLLSLTGFIGGVGGEGSQGKYPLLTIINRHFKMGGRGAKFVKMCTKLFFPHKKFIR